MKSKQDYIDALDSLKCLAFQCSIECVKDRTVCRHFTAGIISAAFFAGAITQQEKRDLLAAFKYWGAGMVQYRGHSIAVEAANDSSSV